jgi:hypothetical protein
MNSIDQMTTRSEMSVALVSTIEPNEVPWYEVTGFA